MNNVEINKLSIQELKDKLLLEKEKYRKLEFAHNVTAIENPMRLRYYRRFIARMSTILSQKETSNKK